MQAYEKRVVVYIDILGFRNHLRSRSLGDLIEGVTAFRNTFASESLIEGLKYQSVQVSDAIVIGARIESWIAFMRFQLITSLSLGTFHLNTGYFARGAIAYGDYFNDTESNLIVSPALSRAYELETTLANFPRIILEPGLIESVEKDLGPPPPKIVGDILGTTKTDTDGLTFINYLEGYGTDHVPDPKNRNRRTITMSTAKMLQCLSIHKGSLEKALVSAREQSPNVLMKFIWLANYHNRFVVGKGLTQLSIDEHFLRI
jgi:hypothetical protein